MSVSLLEKCSEIELNYILYAAISFEIRRVCAKEGAIGILFVTPVKEGQNGLAT